MRSLYKHLKPILLSVAVLCQIALHAQGQQRVNGTILDGGTNQPLIGATVVVVGTSAGTIVGADGKFSLQATPDQTLFFSCLGYSEVSITVAEFMQNPVAVMNARVEVIDDIVVVGYGVQRKASTVAAITQIDGQELLKGGNISTVGEALQGKLNGVIAINKTGQPGSNNAELLIRGKSSWNGNSPLVLVDGVERDFNDVDMNEIQSLSVLKDASATAVYGVRGANGVILLTTKRGTGATPKVTFSSSVGLRQPTRELKWADYLTSMDLWNEAQANDNKWTLIPESTISAWENAFATGNYGPYNDVFPQVDWYKEMVRTFSVSQNYNVNISGSSEFMKYFASVGYMHEGDNYRIQKQEQFDPRYYYNRYNWRSNFDFDLTSSTRLSVSISGNMGYRNNFNSNNGQRNVMAQFIQSPSNQFPIKYSDGTWGDSNSEMFNIVAAYASRGQRTFKTLRNWYDLKFDQKLDFITEGLSFSAQYSYNTQSSTESSIIPGNIMGLGDIFTRDRMAVRYLRTYDYSKPTTNPDGSISYPYTYMRFFDSEAPEAYPVGVNYDALNNYSRRQYYEFALNYARKFGDHNVTALALVNRQIVNEKGSGMVLKFPSYREDWVGRVTYDYKSRYLLEVNMSYTGSEKFAPANRFGFFPSFSLGWRLTEESFMKGTKDWLSSFKVRYSWGQVGSDAIPGGLSSPYLYLSSFTQSGDGIQLGAVSNMTAPSIYREGFAPNLAAGWETGTKQNLGFEISLWNKLNIALDLYDEKRDGILSKARTIAYWFGAGYPTLGLGKTKNHGIELELGWKDKIGKDFHYFVDFGFAASENRIVFNDDPDDPIENPPHLQQAGKPIDFQQRYIAAGNFWSIDDVFNHASMAISSSNGIQIPGDLVYMDFNGDGQIDDKDRVVTEKLNYPQATLSLNFGFDWKGFGFSALLYSPQGIYRNMFEYYYLDFPYNQIKAQPNALDRWTYATANSSGVKRPTVHLNGDTQAANMAENTFRYVDYSYIRLKNVELSYTFPKAKLGKVGIDNLRVYLAGSNLFTITSLDKRLDPETSAQDQYPITKSYTVGLNFAF
jgi:TonB-linked SusC/RagA family outer membrane protein